MRRLAAPLLGLGLLVGCGEPPPDPRPSILLVVIDTLRADAVSAYGRVSGTTPALDALAAEGLLYSRAFAPSPWTLPSHATLLTGLGVERHGVGVDGAMALAGDLPTLAEALRGAGYRGAGFSENPLVGRPFGLARGFESFASASVEQALAVRGSARRFDLLARVRTWLEGPRDGRPEFVFVNFFDPHDPYLSHERNPFLPEGIAGDAAEEAVRGAGLCDRLPGAERLVLLRGLYLGEVAVADAKLGRLRALLAEARPGRRWITLVTSDHGEHLGEHRLLGHEFSVRNVALHVPLVVHGLPGVEPARIEAPVELADVAPSLLAWAGLADRAPLPTRAGKAGPARSLFSMWSDAPLVTPDSIEGGEVDSAGRDRKRAACGEEDRVFGDTLSVLRYPLKLIWFERHPPQLYDLRWDLRELSDLAGAQPQRVAELGAELERYRRSLREAKGAHEPDSEAARALRALGYAE